MEGGNKREIQIFLLVLENHSVSNMLLKQTDFYKLSVGEEQDE